MRRACAVGLVVWVALCARDIGAHPLAPSLLELRERAGGRVELSLRSPVPRASAALLTPTLPDGCRTLGPPRLERDAQAETLHLSLDCGEAPLAGRELGLDGLRESGTNALVRVELEDGSSDQAVIDADHPRFVLPARAERADTIRSFLRLGFRHILGGFDHLLFVAGLVMLVRGRRALLATVTAFTVGHAVTLSCAALGFVRPPVAPIEVAIAASVFWLALELAATGSRTVRPTRLAFGFGLLHGFGFAAALSEAGLPGVDVPLALASFNSGIELGQLAVVCVLLVFVRALRRFERPLAYAFGAVASFWLIERSLVALGLG